MDESVEDRMNFIKKVYSILSVQLTFTAAFTFVVMMAESTFMPILANQGVASLVLVTYCVSFCALACCGQDKKVPINYILLAVFTFCVSYIVALTCVKYTVTSVVQAATLTAGVSIALTVYAATTKTDFTIFGPLLFIFGFVFSISSIFFFLAWGPVSHLLFSAIGVVLFSFYLIYDTQVIIGGKNRQSALQLDDYILASVILYLDIINLFLYILSLTGEKK
jgi:hypothetical protein